MDCKTARLLLDYARPKPAELAEGAASALEGHLHTCPDCDALARGERQFDAHLGRAVRDVPMPNGLRDRLLTRLAAERRGWYHRQARRWGPLAAAVAAALVFALYWYWPRHSLPTPDLYAIEFPVSTQLNQDKSATGVFNWFRDTRNLTVQVPSEIRGEGTLDYSLLTYYDLAPCQGQQVPMLLFVSGSQQARIYILSDGQFNLAEYQADNNGPVTVLYRRPLPEGHVVYVIVLTGTNSLRQFLSRVENRPAA